MATAAMMQSIPSLVVRGDETIETITAALQMTNATQQVVEMLVFNQRKSLATSTVVLTAFNILVSLMTIMGILYDTWKAHRSDDIGFEKRKRKLAFLWSIHPAEVFPLIVSIAIVIQGLVFAGVESKGMSNLRIQGCTRIAMFVWIALWIVPITIQVFALETTIRALRNPRFPRRGKYHVLVSLIVVVTCVALTWIPTKLYPAKDKCVASLMFYVRKYGKAGVVTLSTLMGVISLCAIIISTQLARNVKICREERISASRMVYYLMLSVLIMSFSLPYFIQRFRKQDTDITAAITLMATIALNLWGLTFSALHVFLRANARNTAIKPATTPWTSNKRLTIFGPNDLNVSGSPMEVPILGRSDSTTSYSSRLEKPPLPYSQKLPKSPSKISLRSFKLPGSPRTPLVNAVGPETAETGLSRKPSYSLFPRKTRELSGFTSPAPRYVSKPPRAASSFYGPSLYPGGDDNNVNINIGFQPPRPDYLRHHRRESSMVSSATVQIGLRISNAIAMGVAPDSDELAPPPLRLPSKTKDAGLGGRMKTLPPTPRERGMSGLHLNPPTLSPPATLSPRVYQATSPGGTWI